jgi:DNA-binding MarR family transcriptional regulator
MLASPQLQTPPHENLGVLLGLVRSEILRAMEAELAVRGSELRFVQFLILKRLAKLGPMSAGELARAVDLDGGAMTRQLDQLESKGYLRRCPHEQDRRALRIELTDAGKDLWQQLRRCGQRVMRNAEAPLAPAERAQLRELLERILNALREKS